MTFKKLFSKNVCFFVKKETLFVSRNENLNFKSGTTKVMLLSFLLSIFYSKHFSTARHNLLIILIVKEMLQENTTYCTILVQFDHCNFYLYNVCLIIWHTTISTLLFWFLQHFNVCWNIIQTFLFVGSNLFFFEMIDCLNWHTNRTWLQRK